MARIPIKRKKSCVELKEDLASKERYREKVETQRDEDALKNTTKQLDKAASRRRKVREHSGVSINGKVEENENEDGVKKIRSNRNSHSTLKEKEKKPNTKGGCTLRKKSSCEPIGSTGETLKLLNHKQVNKQLEEIRRMRNNGQDLVDLKRWTKMEGWMRVISEDTLKGIALVANDEMMCGAKPERVKHTDQKFSVSDNVRLSILAEAKANFIGTQLIQGAGKKGNGS